MPSHPLSLHAQVARIESGVHEARSRADQQKHRADMMEQAQAQHVEVGQDGG